MKREFASFKGDFCQLCVPCVNFLHTEREFAIRHPRKYTQNENLPYNTFSIVFPVLMNPAGPPAGQGVIMAQNGSGRVMQNPQPTGIMGNTGGIYRWVCELPLLISLFLLMERWKMLGAAAPVVALFGCVMVPLQSMVTVRIS